MEPLRFCGEWFQTRPRDIHVKEFVGWRRVRGERRFQPYAIIEVAGCEILFDGYDSVWSLIDALFREPLPRRAVNAAMKGDMLGEKDWEWQPFVLDLQAFARESDVHTLTIQVSGGRPGPHPFSPSATYDGFLAHDILAFASSTKVDSMEYLACSPLFLYATTLPFRDEKGLRFVPTLVFGSRPNFVFVQSVGKGHATFGVRSRGREGDVRMERWFTSNDHDLIDEKIVSLLDKLNRDQRNFPVFPVETNALYSIERDEIECIRSAKGYLSE